MKTVKPEKNDDDTFFALIFKIPNLYLDIKSDQNIDP